MSFDGTIRIPEGVGVVMIGRNEGDRLRRSLERLADKAPAVYVDSGSSDGSADLARSLGFAAVDLDDSVPHTAARGRNAGFAYVQAHWPGLDYIFFHDSDCLIDSDFFARAKAELDGDERVAVVAGIQSEQHPEDTVFNRLMDMEWEQPFGDVTTVVGNAMIRRTAFEAADGFRTDLVAGEEADLHIRLRSEGWVVRRIDAPMTQHDAEMTRLAQWWKRHVRSGHAVAEGARLHGALPERHQVKQQRSNFFWGLAVPAAGVLGAPLTLGLSTMVPVAGLSALYAKILKAELAAGRSLEDAELNARFTVLSKFPQALGQLKYHYNRTRGRKTDTIDYRDAGEGRD